MAKPELIDYIKRHIEKGYKHSEIKKILKRAGHEEKVIVEAFEDVFRIHPHLKGKARRKLSKEKAIVAGTVTVLAFILIIFLSRIFAPTQEAEAREIVLPEQCEGLTENFDIYRCILQLSAEEDTTEYCNHMPTGSMLSNCRERIWEDECLFQSIISEEGFDYASCKFENMVQFADADECDSIEPELVEGCYDEFAYDSLNMTLCRTEDCITAFAISYNDMSICTNLDTKEGVGRCIINSALHYNNTDYCDSFGEYTGFTGEICTDYFDNYFDQSFNWTASAPVESRYDIGFLFFDGPPYSIYLERGVEKIIPDEGVEI